MKKTILSIAMVLTASMVNAETWSSSHTTRFNGHTYNSTTSGTYGRSGTTGKYRMRGSDGSSVNSNVRISPSGHFSGSSTTYIPGVGTTTCRFSGTSVTCY